MQAVGTFEGLMEEITQYKESDALLGDETVAQGDFAIAQGLKFTNKAANGIHSMSCKVGNVSLAACALAVVHLCFCWRVSEVQARRRWSSIGSTPWPLNFMQAMQPCASGRM